MSYLPLYSERQARRHEVRPGITGLAQVSGRNDLNWDTRFETDVAYVEDLSLSLDHADHGHDQPPEPRQIGHFPLRVDGRQGASGHAVGTPTKDHLGRNRPSSA